MKRAYEVIVVGGGTAGAAAGISAARDGAKTLIIERLGALGGTQTSAWVTPQMPNHLGSHKLSRGFNLDVLSAQAELQPPGDLEHGDEWYDPIGLAFVLDQLCQESGAEALFDATLVSVKRNGRKIESIVAMTRGGLIELTANCFIDSTGDAALSLLAGAELQGGDETGRHQPMTLRFFMAGIDMAALRDKERDILRLQTPDYVECGYHDAKDGALGDRIRTAVAQGRLNEDDLGYFQFFSVNGRPGELAFNAPRISDLDPLDPFEFSRAYQVGRAKIARISQFLRERVRGFEKAYVSGVAPMMGIRESRRVVCEYMLTADDHQNCRKFEDTIARNRYPVDIHLKTGTDYRKYPPGEYHDIPYRSLVAKGFDNLWVAGRCAGADFVAQSAIRIQPVCRAMGQAAGIAAARCARQGLPAMQLPYTELASQLDLAVS